MSKTMKVLRTPDSAFARLPAFPYKPHYAFVGTAGVSSTLRVAYIDEGPRDATETVLCLHGEPSWSFLYRKMVPVLTSRGYRVVCPDLVGFGRSDKPAAQSDYTYARHVSWMRQVLFGKLDLKNITLVCQDWGGLVGLRLLAEHNERFARVVTANTGLPTGDQNLGEAFLKWREYSKTVPEFPVGTVVQRGTATDLPDDVVAAYDAPFPDETFKAGARIFPSLVPATPDDPAAEANREAWGVLSTMSQPLVTLFSDSDPITRGGEKPFQSFVPSAAGQPHATMVGGGHFLQEDVGVDLALHTCKFIESTQAVPRSRL